MKKKSKLTNPIALMKQAPAVVVSFVAGACFLLFIFRAVTMRKDHIQSISYYVPFTFSRNIDPRHIVTVGDQVVSEHVLAFHGRESLRDGFGAVISEVIFDDVQSTVTLIPKHRLKTSKGDLFPVLAMCDSIKSSLRGTSHAPLAPLVQTVDCDEEQIVIRFRALPVNIRYLFTLADFSIFDQKYLPLSPDNIAQTTGPYVPTLFSPMEIKLRRNPYYPKDLVANQVEEVQIRSYRASQSKQLIASVSPETIPLVYLYGYALSSEDIDSIRSKKYKIRRMPSEWMIYFGIQKGVRYEDRVKFSHFASQWRDSLMKYAPLGQPAYSLSPSDRPFGLSLKDYIKAGEERDASLGVEINRKLSKSYTLATLDEWAEIPIFEKALEYVRDEFPEIRIELLRRDQIETLWSNKVDFLLSPLGISPADPINNFSFLTEFESLISKERIVELSILKKADDFNSALLELERKIISDALWVPIGHFPGVVIEAPGYDRDERIAWSWGVQAWTYHIPLAE